MITYWPTMLVLASVCGDHGSQCINAQTAQEIQHCFTCPLISIFALGPHSFVGAAAWV